MIEAYSEYEITNSNDFTTEKGGLILAKDKVVLYGVAQCSVVNQNRSKKNKRQFVVCSTHRFEPHVIHLSLVCFLACR